MPAFRLQSHLSQLRYPATVYALGLAACTLSHDIPADSDDPGDLVAEDGRFEDAHEDRPDIHVQVSVSVNLSDSRRGRDSERDGREHRHRDHHGRDHRDAGALVDSGPSIDDVDASAPDSYDAGFDDSDAGSSWDPDVDATLPMPASDAACDEGLIVIEQTVVDTCWGIDLTPRHGQTFTATATGKIVSFGMHLQYNGNGPMEVSFYDGAGFTGTKLHTEFVTTPYEVGHVSPMLTYVLSNPMPVVANHVYTIGVGLLKQGEPGAYCGALSNLYGGGTAYVNEKPWLPIEAAFRVTIAPD